MSIPKGIRSLAWTVVLTLSSTVLHAEPPDTGPPVHLDQTLGNTSPVQAFTYFSGYSSRVNNTPAIYVGRSMRKGETITVVGRGELVEFPMSRFADAVARYKALLETQGFHPFERARMPLSHHPILGSWVITDKQAECSGTRVFERSGRGTGKSEQEATVSQFEISARPSAKGYYRMVDTIVEDNGNPDCAGHTTPVGDQALVFIRFAPGLGSYSICRNEDESSCFASAKRINTAPQR